MSGYTIVVSTVTSLPIGPGGSVDGTATCLAPKRVLGGGYSVGSNLPMDNVSVWSSAPKPDMTGWTAKAQRDNFVPPGGTANITLTVFAICGNASP